HQHAQSLPYRLSRERHWRVRRRRAGLGGPLWQSAASIRLRGHAQAARARRDGDGRLLVLCRLTTALLGRAGRTALNSAEAIVGGDRLVAALGCADLVENCRKHDAKNDV